MALIVATSLSAQRQRQAKPSARDQAELAELTKLRDQYVAATQEYKRSLEKLMALYVEGKERAIQRHTQAEKLVKENLLSEGALEQSSQAILEAQKKIDSVREQLKDADERIANVPTVAELAKQRRQVVARQPSCRNWTLTAYRRETKRTTTVAVRLVCQH